MILSFFSVKIIPGSYIMHEFNLCYSRIFITQSYYIFNAAFSPDAVVPLLAFHFLDHLKPCEILCQRVDSRIFLRKTVGGLLWISDLKKEKY